MQRRYCVEDLEKMLLRKYGTIPAGDWDAYRYLKKCLGVLEESLSVREYHQRIKLIIRVLEL